MLINALISHGATFYGIADFIKSPGKKGIIIRHDVDKLPANSLIFARIQADKGISGTYYFRIVNESFDKKIIKEIYSLGHEIGYHYEDMGIAARQNKGVVTEEEIAKIAIKKFKENLEKLRQLVPIKTICMHGSPMSNWDSRSLWKHYDYHDYGINGEPYFDINFNDVFYLTDTGRRWDGNSFNIRDKSISSKAQVSSFSSFHSTLDIITATEMGMLPNKVMMTFHPQRWTNRPLPWIKELVWQNAKNVGKYCLIYFKS